MSTPILKLRKDIWAHFPVNVDSMGRGANGADRHCIEWHNMKVRQLAAQKGMTEPQLKAMLLPQMLHALSKSTAWTVEAAPPGSKCVAVLVMKFVPRNNTKKNSVKKNSPKKQNNTRKWRNNSPTNVRANAEIKANNTRTSPAKNKKNKNNNNATRKVAKNHSALTGADMIRKGRLLLNQFSDEKLEKLSREFASLRPRTLSEFDELMKVIADIATDQQVYHPFIIHLLHVLDETHKSYPYPQQPSSVVAERVMTRALEEPVYAKMEVADEDAASPNKNIEEKVQLQRRFFRSTMLLTGFLYRDGFLPWTSYKRLLHHVAAMALETDPAELDYRIRDGYIQGLLYTLIRGGARMVAEGGEAAATFQKLLTGITTVSKEAKRTFIRVEAAEFLDSVTDGFKIKPMKVWTIGAPVGDVKVKKNATAAQQPQQPQQPQQQQQQQLQGLGADLGELWRRFPLDVKEDGNQYIVRFHNKKLTERYEREQGRFRSLDDYKSYMSKMILSLVDNSLHWKRLQQPQQQPQPQGVLMIVVKK